MATRREAPAAVSNEADAVLNSTVWAVVETAFEQAMLSALEKADNAEDAWKLTCVLKAGRMHKAILGRLARHNDNAERAEILKKAVA